MKATRVANYEEGLARGPGAFWYEVDEQGKPKRLVFITPDSDTSAFETAHLGAARLGGDGWQFDGNLDAPTLSPSLLVELWNSKGIVYRWHGYLRNGEFEDA